MLAIRQHRLGRFRRGGAIWQRFLSGGHNNHIYGGGKAFCKEQLDLMCAYLFYVLVQLHDIVVLTAALATLALGLLADLIVVHGRRP